MGGFSVTDSTGELDTYQNASEPMFDVQAKIFQI